MVQEQMSAPCGVVYDVLSVTASGRKDSRSTSSSTSLSVVSEHVSSPLEEPSGELEPACSYTISGSPLRYGEQLVRDCAMLSIDIDMRIAIVGPKRVFLIKYSSRLVALQDTTAIAEVPALLAVHVPAHGMCLPQGACHGSCIEYCARTWAFATLDTCSCFVKRRSGVYSARLRLHSSALDCYSSTLPDVGEPRGNMHASRGSSPRMRPSNVEG
jgi:hypothetical protein